MLQKKQSDQSDILESNTQAIVQKTDQLLGILGKF